LSGFVILLSMNRKSVRVGLTALCIVLMAVSAFLYLRITRNSEEPDSAQKSEVLIESNDISLLSVDEVSTRYTDKEQQYDVLLSNAQSKELYAKYDEAYIYYEATLDAVNETDLKKLEYTHYLIYLFGKRSGRDDIEKKYADFLGTDTIARLANEEQQREYNR
jgi:hypothetical protein